MYCPSEGAILAAAERLLTPLPQEFGLHCGQPTCAYSTQFGPLC